MQIKYKFLSFEELVINLDRLTRFKLPEISYNRVFNSIILKNLISPKYSQSELENLDTQYIAKIVQEIWNKSVIECTKQTKENPAIHKAIKIIAKNTFTNTDEKTKILINTKLLLRPIIEKLEYKNLPYNLKFLYIANKKLNNNNFEYNDLLNLRKKYSLLFPISRLIIVEGITEEILLPVFGNKLNHNYDKEGTFIYGAGGKSKSPALYVELKNKLKIPIRILFDSDAIEQFEILKNNTNKKDKIIVIQKGEFEDIIPTFLIKRALNKEYLPATSLTINELKSAGMCKNIENFYKTRHLGEYKKSKVAKIIAKNIKYKTDISKDIENITLSLL